MRGVKGVWAVVKGESDLRSMSWSVPDGVGGEKTSEGHRRVALYPDFKFGGVGAAVGPFAGFFAENFLAEADLGGGDFDEFVVLDVFQGVSRGDIWRGGLRRMFLSEPEARMLVSFFSLQGLTTRSLSRAFSATIMPS